VAPNDVQELESAGRYTLVDFPRKGLGMFLAYNVNQPPFDDVLVRRAIAHLVQKEPLVAIALQGRGQVACGPLPPSIVGYWAGMCDYAPAYDPDAGYALLTEAGYVREGGTWRKDGQPLAFAITAASLFGWSPSAQVVQEQLREHGIDATINVIEFTTLLSSAREGTLQALTMAYTYTSADILNSYLNSGNIGTGYNWSHHASPQVDEWLALSRATSDDVLRAETYASLQRYVVDEALWLPLWINDNYFAIQPRLQDARLSTEGFLFLNDARVAD
jgi:peptide/nickel transport system substrate-binding protein